MKMSNIEMLPQYSTVKFTDVWESAADFCYTYQNIGIPKIIKVENAQTLYYLLYAKYGNSPIANRDVEQFKYKIFSIVYQYGPTWEKKLDIQAKLRAISDDDLLKGAKAIYNSAMNPSTAPATQTLDELPYINGQNTTNYKKSKMDAYGQLWELLNTDVTGQFLTKFKDCFKKFVRPEMPLVYITEEEDEQGE